MPYSRGGRSEAQQNSPPPFRVAGRDGISVQNLQNLKTQAGPASAAEAPKKDETTAENISQRDAQGDPKIFQNQQKS